jgi:hypothetical protein
MGRRNREKDNYFKRLRQQRLTHDEKIITTVALCILVPIVVVLNVFIQSAVTFNILLATPNMASKNLFMETNDNKLPYRRKSKETIDSNTGTIWDHVDTHETPLVKKQQGGRKKKKYRQKGGNMSMPTFNNVSNGTKAFLDSTKFGMPYEWAENDNFIINSFGEYFITIWTTYRTVYGKALEVVNETFYKQHPENPSNMGDYIMDWAKIAILAPIFNQLIYVANWAVGIGTLVWGSINNQGLFGMLFWGAVAVCSIFFGLFQGYFWPFNFMSTYYTASLFTQNFWKKVDMFQTYGNRWKFWWVFVMLCWLFATINWTWATRKGKNKVDYDKQVLIGTGVGFGVLFISMLGIVSVI